MHDIGKIGVPDGILLKASPLTELEREQMKLHAQRGFRMLDGSSSRLLRLASEIALTQHERWDDIAALVEARPDTAAHAA